MGEGETPRSPHHKRLTIAVLLHRRARRFFSRKYIVNHLAEVWRKEGHRVVFLYGTRKSIPADICLVHVDLSVVPPEYITFANRYPVVVNGKILDIRKRAFTQHELFSGDNYQGQVIVKSNENYAGWPEQLLTRNLASLVYSRLSNKWRLPTRRFSSSEDYLVFERLTDVPEKYFQDSYFLVEKFLPEKVDGIYYVNQYIFNGPCELCIRLGSTEPVVKSKSLVSKVLTDPHPEMRRVRERMAIDYGKLDYCIHEGNPVLIDINKTVGFAGGGPLGNEVLRKIIVDRARALYAFLPDHGSRQDQQ